MNTRTFGGATPLVITYLCFTVTCLLAVFLPPRIVHALTDGPVTLAPERLTDVLRVAAVSGLGVLTLLVGLATGLVMLLGRR